MLESSWLMIGPWLPPTQGRRRCWHRLLRDASTDLDAGFALWQPGIALSWLHFLWPAVLSVHEAEDEPLVFTARRSWAPLPRWEIQDADGRNVGVVRKRWLVDSRGRPVAYIDREGKGEVTHFRGSDAQDLAMFIDKRERELHFSENSGESPFTKMLVLAAALTI